MKECSTFESPTPAVLNPWYIKFKDLMYYWFAISPNLFWPISDCMIEETKIFISAWLVFNLYEIGFCRRTWRQRDYLNNYCMLLSSLSTLRFSSKFQHCSYRSSISFNNRDGLLHNYFATPRCLLCTKLDQSMSGIVQVPMCTIYALFPVHPNFLLQ